MRKDQTIKIGLYVILAVLLLTAVGIVVYTSMQNKKEPDNRSYDMAQEQIKEREDDASDLKQVSSTPQSDIFGQRLSDAETEHGTETDKALDVTYRLAVADGYLQVYIVQTGTLYMETAIAYELLPERVQRQIEEGKYFESEENLLEFLESYSS